MRELRDANPPPKAPEDYVPTDETQTHGSKCARGVDSCGSCFNLSKQASKKLQENRL